MFVRALAAVALFACPWWSQTAAAVDDGGPLASAGLTKTIVNQIPEARISVTIDYARFFASYDTWQQFKVSEWDFRNRPISLLYSISLAALDPTVHTLFVKNSAIETITAVSAVHIGASGSDAGDHELFHFTLTRAQDQRIDWDSLDFNDLPNAIPAFNMAAWTEKAIHDQNEKIAAMPILSVDDIILDMDSLKGKDVRVTGYTACLNGTSPCFFFRDPTNFVKGVIYKSDELPRADRRELMSCSILAPCKIVMVARVVGSPLDAVRPTWISWDQGLRGGPPGSPPAPARAADAKLSVKDFILDRAQLAGRIVNVEGLAQCSGFSCWLTEMGFLQEQVAGFDASALPRDDRKRLLDCNQIPGRGCSAAVTGRVAGDTLRADSIVWE
jgi:hypothetical protein